MSGEASRSHGTWLPVHGSMPDLRLGCDEAAAIVLL